MPWVFALLLAVGLTPPFQQAEATAVEAGNGLRVEVVVVVEGEPTVVLARGRTLVDELPPVAMTRLEGDRWGGVVELTAIQDIALGFEAIMPDGTAVLSDLHLLSELGVDPAVFSIQEEPAPGTGGVPDEGEDAGPWGWVALGAGLAAVVLLGVWALLGRRQGEPEGNQDEPEPVPADE